MSKKFNESLLGLKVEPTIKELNPHLIEAGKQMWAKITQPFEEKHAKLGGDTGLLGKATTNVEATPDGTGYFQHFAGGSLYSFGQGVFEVHGAIRAKWSLLGWERSLLGFPLTDESKTADGIGRYNHFQHGSIYWTPQTGAFEVHGAIRQRWQALGWERGWLGYPTSNELITPSNYRVSHFQHGSIHWSPQTGPIEVGNYTLRFKGIICFGEQSWINEKGDSDEPYLIVTAYTGDGQVDTQRFPPDQSAFNEVNSGSVIPWIGDCYHGSAGVLNVRCALMEHDEGDPNKYRDTIHQVVSEGVQAGTVAATGGTPVEIPADATGLLTGAINALLDTGDDLIAEGYRAFTYLDANQIIDQPMKEERGIWHHFDIYLTDGDATYKAYFEFVRA